MKKQILSLIILLLPFLGFSQDFMIYQKPFASSPPLSRLILLDDGAGNYTSTSLQKIIDAVPIPEAEGDGFVNGFSFNAGTNQLSLTQNGASNFSVSLAALNNTYTLPTASNITLGGVRAGSGGTDAFSGLYMDGGLLRIRTGSGITFDGNGGITADVYTLPTASSITKGGVRIGSGLTMTGDVLSATGGSYSLPAATNSTRGGIRAGGSSGSAANGLQITGDFMTVATSAGIGIYGGGVGVNYGSGLSISGNTLIADQTVMASRAWVSANFGSSTYSLPAATASVRGGIKVGNGLAVTSDVLRLNLTPTVVERNYPSSSIGLSTGSSVDVFDETFTVTSGALTFIDVNVASNTLTSADVRLTLYINGVAISSEYEYLPTGASTTPRGNINVSHQFITSSTSLNVRIEGRLYSGSNHNVIAKSMRVSQIK